MLTVVTLAVLLCTVQASPKYKPTWESLDTRPLPQWYDDAKFGILIHWGVFSVPSFGNEWFWHRWRTEKVPKYIEFMEKNYKPDFTYQEFAKEFTAEFFNADKWADLFQASGAKYITLTSKHHEGFHMWPSKYAYSWNSMDVGPNRDIVGELAQSIRKRTNVTFGLYHSLYEWYHPLYLQDKANNYSTSYFVDRKLIPEMYELVNTYKPEVIFSDGGWEATSDYWKSKQFLAWLYNDSPVKDTVVVSDRWGIDAECKHGDYFICKDNFDPRVLQKHKYEDTIPVERQSWAFRRNAGIENYRTIEELLQQFVRTVSCGGNMLVNVGPPKHGSISPIYEERFLQMGSWLKVNGEGIYGSRPWTFQNDTETPGIWYTQKREKGASTTTVYAFVYEWPKEAFLTLNNPKITGYKTRVYLLGSSAYVNYVSRDPGGLVLQLPIIPASEMPCKWLWTFKITYIQN